jgi:small subunit ribosomal protein S20
MPHHKSAKKRLRQSKEQRLRNRGHRTELRHAVKLARENSEKLQGGVSALDVAARRGIIHPNKAARLKSRLMKQHQATTTA